MEEKFVIYQNQSYVFNFELAKHYSQYFLRETKNFEKISIINLVDGTDSIANLHPSSINEFFQFFKNGKIEINKANVIDLHFLSNKYEVFEIIRKTEEYISIHYIEIIKDLFSDTNNINDKISYEYETIINDHLLELDFNELNELLKFKTSIFNRIISHFSLKRQNEKNLIMTNEEEDKLSTLLLKRINLYGSETIRTFANIEIIKKSRKCMNVICTSYLNDEKNCISSYYQMIKYLYENLKEMNEINTNYEKKIEEQENILNDCKEKIERYEPLISGLISVKLPAGFKVINSNILSHCKEEINEIILPSSVTSIENHAFCGCKKFSQITILSTTIEIGEKAFDGVRFLRIKGNLQKLPDNSFIDCKALIQVILPNSIQCIGKCSFKNCNNLSEITIPKSVEKIEEDAFFGISKLEIKGDLQYLPDNSFKGCSTLTQIILPSSIQIIGNYSFKNCNNLSEITIPKSVEKIGEDAFFGISKLEIKGDLQYLPDNSFKRCSTLTQIILPSLIQTIGQNAFDGCWELKEITISKSIKEIKENAFWGINKLEIKGDIQYLPDRSFQGCSTLTQISLPYSLQCIGSYSFNKCNSLKQIKILSSNIEIKKGAFLGIETIEISGNIENLPNNSFEKCSFTQIVLSESIRSIGNNSFSNCLQLTQILIPSSVQYIGNQAFSYCSKLKEITIPKSVISIGNQAFYSCRTLSKVIIDAYNTQYQDDSFSYCESLKYLIIPSLHNGKYYAFICSSWTSIMFNYFELFEKKIEKLFVEFIEVHIEIKYPSEQFNAIYKKVYEMKRKWSTKLNICIFYTDMNITDTFFQNNNNIKYLKFGSQVTGIFGDKNNGSFKGCYFLSYVSIPSTVTFIGENAFRKCPSLTHVFIPSSVTMIKSNAFRDCISLSQVTFPPSIKSIGPWAFYNCPSLLNVEIPSLASIGYDAFPVNTKVTKI